jgi:putative oxidoreductase
MESVSAARRHRRSRWVNGLCVALAVVYLVSGAAKLIGVQAIVELFATWGYPAVLLPVIGSLEVLGALGLLIPRVASLAALTLALVMLGAVCTHLFRGFAPLAIVPALCLAALVFIAKERLNAPQGWVMSWRREKA